MNIIQTCGNDTLCTNNIYHDRTSVYRKICMGI